MGVCLIRPSSVKLLVHLSLILTPHVLISLQKITLSKFPSILILTINYSISILTIKYFPFSSFFSLCIFFFFFDLIDWGVWCLFCIIQYNTSSPFIKVLFMHLFHFCLFSKILLFSANFCKLFLPPKNFQGFYWIHFQFSSNILSGKIL